MKPVDFRNATFADLEERIAGQRAFVLAAWEVHGPGTTAEVCAHASMSILSFRPRSTELFQLGFICLTDAQPEKGEGTYRVRTIEEHRAWMREQQLVASAPQRQLGLNV